MEYAIDDLRKHYDEYKKIWSDGGFKEDPVQLNRLITHFGRAIKDIGRVIRAVDDGLLE